MSAAGDGFVCRPMGEVQVRGRSRPVEVYAVEGTVKGTFGIAVAPSPM